MLNAHEDTEVQEQNTESATAPNEELESGEVENIDNSLSEDTTDDHDEQDNASEGDNDPDLTPGVAKRIAKLKARQEREVAEIRAEFDAKLHQFQQQIARTQQPLQTEQMLQQQYQQQYGQFQNQYQPNGYVDPYQQQQQAVPTFEQFKQWQHKAEAEKKQQSEQAEFQTGINTVLQNVQARRYQDPEFAKLDDTYGNLFTPQMVYALKGLKNPSSFVKHVLKNPKDHAALRQLQSRNQFEQVAAISEWATKYETQSQNRTQVAPKPKPISQPKAGGSVNARVNVGLDPHNSSTWQKEKIKAFMRGERV